jgi:hypothetical protein
VLFGERPKLGRALAPYRLSLPAQEPLDPRISISALKASWSVQTIGAGRFAGSIKPQAAWPTTSIPRSGWIGTFGNLAVRLSVAVARSLICPASTTGTHVTPSVEKSTCPPSIGSWADDVRDDRPESYRWHFVGDIHQPLHTVGEGRGGNDVAVEVRLAGAKTCRSRPCPIMVYRSNLHRVWDSTLIKATAWSWGAYVDRLEGGWLASPEARGVDSGYPGAVSEGDPSCSAHRVGAAAGMPGGRRRLLRQDPAHAQPPTQLGRATVGAVPK